ncbi:MAG: DUF1844 domain-containing protein [Candidatus Omnitrophica bacterium]|nr:DUF1844 domain-containing protein [Candidatus Omnitrophota bacterium]
MNEEIRKKIDEDWKSQIEKEKQKALQENQNYYEPTFSIFLSSLIMQAMIALGKLESPITNKIEKNLDQARFLIDTIALLKEKTKNNLTKEEENLLEDSLANLRMIYVEVKNNP